MRVAVIIDTWFPFIGGGQINAWEISKRLATKGVGIDIVTRNCGKDKLKRVRNLNVYKLGAKSAPNDSISKIFFILRSFFFIYNKDYDLIHAQAFLPGITARLLMVFRGIPAIFTVHGFSFNTNLNNIFSRWLERFILTKILYSAQITVSQDFLNLKNINEQVMYIPNAVNIGDFDAIKVPKFKDPTLIFVGRLHPQKNLKNLILAINLMRKKLPSVKLLIVGSGMLKKDLTNLVESLKLQNNVKLLGQKTGDDLIKLYKSSHIFILPSIYEGQPLSLLEAWAAKLPVIVARTGDCPHLVKNAENGYLLSSNGPEDIQKSVSFAFSDKNNLRSIGLTGYRTLKSLSWDKSANETLRLYKSLLHN